MTEYRLRLKRVDPKNIAIQRKSNGRWISIYYCGNNLKSLIRGLLELILVDYTPEGIKLSDELRNIELELISGLERIEKIAKEAIDNV